MWTFRDARKATVLCLGGITVGAVMGSLSNPPTLATWYSWGVVAVAFPSIFFGLALMCNRKG